MTVSQPPQTINDVAALTKTELDKIKTFVYAPGILGRIRRLTLPIATTKIIWPLTKLAFENDKGKSSITKEWIEKALDAKEIRKIEQEIKKNNGYAAALTEQKNIKEKALWKKIQIPLYDQFTAAELARKAPKIEEKSASIQTIEEAVPEQNDIQFEQISSFKPNEFTHFLNENILSNAEMRADAQDRYKHDYTENGLAKQLILEHLDRVGEAHLLAQDIHLGNIDERMEEPEVSDLTSYFLEQLEIDQGANLVEYSIDDIALHLQTDLEAEKPKLAKVYFIADESPEGDIICHSSTDMSYGDVLSLQDLSRTINRLKNTSSEEREWMITSYDMNVSEEDIAAMDDAGKEEYELAVFNNKYAQAMIDNIDAIGASFETALAIHTNETDQSPQECENPLLTDFLLKNLQVSHAQDSYEIDNLYMFPQSIAQFALLDKENKLAAEQEIKVQDVVLEQEDAKNAPDFSNIQPVVIIDNETLNVEEPVITEEPSALSVETSAEPVVQDVNFIIVTPPQESRVTVIAPSTQYTPTATNKQGVCVQLPEGKFADLPLQDKLKVARQKSWDEVEETEAAVEVIQPTTKTEKTNEVVSESVAEKESGFAAMSLQEKLQFVRDQQTPQILVEAQENKQEVVTAPVETEPAEEPTFRNNAQSVSYWSQPSTSSSLGAKFAYTFVR